MTATKTPAQNPADVIKAAQEKVTLPTSDPNRKRALRDAALDAVAATYGPFTVVEEVNLKDDEPKFSAWITGARGRNGWVIQGKMGKAIVGATTVQDMIDRKAIKNVDAFKGSKVAEATMKGIIG